MATRRRSSQIRRICLGFARADTRANSDAAQNQGSKTCHPDRSRASTRNSRAGTLLFYGFHLAIEVGYEQPHRSRASTRNSRAGAPLFYNVFEFSHKMGVASFV